MIIGCHTAQLWSYSGPAHGFCFQAWLLCGAASASVACCLSHFCFHMSLHPFSLRAKMKKTLKSNKHIVQNSHKRLPSKFWKSMRPRTHNFSIILPRKFHQWCVTHLYCSPLEQNCYIFQKSVFHIYLKRRYLNSLACIPHIHGVHQYGFFSEIYENYQEVTISVKEIEVWIDYLQLPRNNESEKTSHVLCCHDEHMLK